MARTGSRAELLRVCVQDLHTGKRMLAERLLAEAATDAALRALLAGEAALAGDQAARLAGMGVVANRAEDVAADAALRERLEQICPSPRA